MKPVPLPPLPEPELEVIELEKQEECHKKADEIAIRTQLLKEKLDKLLDKKKNNVKK